MVPYRPVVPPQPGIHCEKEIAPPPPRWTAEWRGEGRMALHQSCMVELGGSEARQNGYRRGKGAVSAALHHSRRARQEVHKWGIPLTWWPPLPPLITLQVERQGDAVPGEEHRVGAAAELRAQLRGSGGRDGEGMGDVWGIVGAAAELWTQLCGPGDGCGRDAGSVVCGGRVGRGCHRTAGTAAMS